MNTTAVKHTPGPWKISHGCLPGDSGFSIGADNAAISGNVKITAECWPCTIVSEDHRQELFANASLIAAAPELLQVARQVEYELSNRGPDVWFQPHVRSALRAAIAKAEGK